MINCLHTLRKLDVSYPHFLSEQELIHRTLKEGNLCQLSEGGKHWLLYRFIIDLPSLHVGGSLLPKLVELYQWLHTRITAHTVTRDRAASMTIGEVVTLAENKIGKHIRELYENVKEPFNKYIRLIGGVRTPNTPFGMKICINDDIPILHFLTGSYAYLTTNLPTMNYMHNYNRCREGGTRQ